MGIFEYEFMQKAFLGGMLLAVLSPAVGTFMVARRSSLIADTLAHVSLLGIAAALLLGSSPILMAVLICIFGAIVLDYLTYKGNLSSDSMQAIFMSGALSIALILSQWSPRGISGIESYLFGSLLTLEWFDLFILLIVSVLCLFLLWWKWWPLLNLVLDEDLARSSGHHVHRLRLLLSTLTGAAIALALPMVGGLLVSALMVIPVLCALQFRSSFKGTFFKSIFIGCVQVLSGLLLSYYFDLPSGASIVVAGITLYILCFGVRKSLN